MYKNVFKAEHSVFYYSFALLLKIKFSNKIETKCIL